MRPFSNSPQVRKPSIGNDFEDILRKTQRSW